MIILFSAISAITTGVIACLTWQNWKIYKAMIKNDEEYKIQIRDLYQAIVISNLVFTGQITQQAIGEFKAHYKGKTKIFE